jgi:hypothetical protein
VIGAVMTERMAIVSVKHADVQGAEFVTKKLPQRRRPCL